MKVITENLGRPGSTLTAYLHGKSDELKADAVRPAVLIFPGGGYRFCSFREGEPVALAYVAEGYNAFVLNYAAGPDAPFAQSFEDAENAIAMLHQRAEQWDIDKNKITVVGFSAGGHLASALGTMGATRPNAMILGYPVTLARIGKDTDRELSGTCDKVDGKMPPTFLFSTRDDSLVPIENSLAFADALDKAGIPFELHIFASGDHALSLAKSHLANGKRNKVNPIVAQWFAMSIDWLKGQFGDFPLE